MQCKIKKDVFPEVDSDAAHHRTLKSLCLLVTDCPHSTPKWTDNGVIVLRNQNIKRGRLDLSNPSYTDENHYLGRIKRAVPQEGDIVITREAPMGDVCQIPPDLKCCLGQRQVLLRPNPDKVDGRYLFYALQSEYLQHQIGWNEGTGSTVSNLRIPVLESLNVPTPPIAIQREISGTLGSIDDSVSLLRGINSTLESIAQVLFKSWFIDFDPVKAKMDGRQPDAMNEATAALFPSELVESEMGLIPKDWKVKTLGETFNLNPSYRLTKGNQAPYLDMANVPISGFRAQQIIDRSFGSGTKFTTGDTLLARITPCLENGKTAYVDFLEENQIGWGSTEFIVMRPRKPLPLEFGYLLARHAPFRTYAIQRMSGTSGRQRVSADTIAGYKLAVPSEPIAHAFAESVGSLFELIKSQDEQSKNLSKIRDSLLPKLMSSQIRLY